MLVASELAARRTMLDGDRSTESVPRGRNCMPDEKKRSDGPADRPLPDLLRRSREVQGEQIFDRFGNGLAIKTEIFRKNDRLRILPLGTPQGSLMNHMLNFPEVVKDKEVFEPFAGSGALGFMALKVGARHVDLLDINPRALNFQVENAALNELPRSCYRSIEGDIATFTADRSYDLILANPPFVPTPEGIEGTITSNGGPEGNRFVESLLKRLEELLYPHGQAFIYLFQIVKRGEPLIVELILRYLDHRVVELTPSQARPISFAVYCQTYAEVFPGAKDDIVRWESDLIGRYGDDLLLNHYVARVGPQADGPTSWVIRDNFKEKYGENLLVPFRDDRDLSYNRILENVLDFGDR
jgi:methyltransferase family protein